MATAAGLEEAFFGSHPAAEVLLAEGKGANLLCAFLSYFGSFIGIHRSTSKSGGTTPVLFGLATIIARSECGRAMSSPGREMIEMHRLMLRA